MSIEKSNHFVITIAENESSGYLNHRNCMPMLYPKKLKIRKHSCLVSKGSEDTGATCANQNDGLDI